MFMISLIKRHLVLAFPFGPFLSHEAGESLPRTSVRSVAISLHLFLLFFGLCSRLAAESGFPMSARIYGRAKDVQ